VYIVIVINHSHKSEWNSGEKEANPEGSVGTRSGATGGGIWGEKLESLSRKKMNFSLKMACFSEF